MRRDCFLSLKKKKDSFYLFEKQRVSERMTERSSICWFILQTTARARAGPC